MNKVLLVSVILLTFAKGIAGSHDPVTREKLIPPFPFNEDKVLERISKMVKKSTTAEFIAKAIKKHPNIDFGKVRYVNAITDISLVCKTCGIEWDATPNSILKGSGCPHCGRTKLVLGVGINDVPTPTRSGNIRNDAYRIWKSMLERCYSDKYHQKEPAYIGCSVCDDWIRFSNFKRWFDKNYVDGYQLDKDILVKGNKVYSPDTCCFVPREINAILQLSKYRLNSGITFNKKGDYAVHVNMYNKKVFLGTFDTIEKARDAYVSAKRDYLYELADKYYSLKMIPEKIYNAIINYEYGRNDFL